ncbi:MAG: peptide/nickel transport system substrate-binding protein [Bacillota bacterium]|nr:MAG: peptide/nickel transport system substrate-binding protein [Bacillota bacterium]MBS3950876.1 ABC transporter substrate-binding protein [Peptococcaceae bacterium]
MIKLGSLLLVLVLVLSLAGCAEKTPAVETTLVVGSSEISGNFLSGFGDSAYDVWVRELISGYETYSTTPTGEIVLNKTVVKNLKTEIDTVGNKTYTFDLHKDMKWNNGTVVTAKDYVFYILWYASPAWTEAGATSTVGEGLIGYQDYYEGEVDRFKGVKLINDYSFSVTIDAEELPYFFETNYASFIPAPMAVWAPGATLDINADGAKIAGLDLVKTASTVATTERFKPTVTSGPYKFVSFENSAVTVKINENFKGTFENKKPQLTYVVIKSINMTTDVDQVINGEIDLVTGVIEGEKIEKAKASKTTSVNYYARNGFGGVFMHCDFGATAIPEVRHALAYLMDRDEIISNVLGGYGSVTNGYYGLAQWMYTKNKAAIDAFPHFVRNIAKANELLNQTEWKFEADGKTSFDPAKANAAGTYLRYNAKKEKLVIKHFGTEDNTVTDNVEIQFKANTPLAGIDFTIARGDFDALLDNYYYAYELKPEERVYHSYNLATNFGATFDPYYSFHSDFLGTWQNANQVNDPELDALMIKMRSLEPTQVTEFSAAWLEFQKRWYEILPIIPLYSNQYYDVFGAGVKGVNTTPFSTWAAIICDISK